MIKKCELSHFLNIPPTSLSYFPTHPAHAEIQFISWISIISIPHILISLDSGSILYPWECSLLFFLIFRIALYFLTHCPVHWPEKLSTLNPCNCVLFPCLYLVYLLVYLCSEQMKLARGTAVISTEITLYTKTT